MVFVQRNFGLSHKTVSETIHYCCCCLWCTTSNFVCSNWLSWYKTKHNLPEQQNKWQYSTRKNSSLKTVFFKEFWKIAFINCWICSIVLPLKLVRYLTQDFLSLKYTFHNDTNTIHISQIPLSQWQNSFWLRHYFQQ